MAVIDDDASTTIGAASRLRRVLVPASPRLLSGGISQCGRRAPRRRSAETITSAEAVVGGTHLGIVDVSGGAHRVAHIADGATDYCSYCTHLLTLHSYGKSLL